MANRLRIARLDPTPYRPLAAQAPDAELHRRLDALIRRHLPAVTASVLAQPVASADGRLIEWYSDLAGQPVALAALDEEAQAAARALLADRLTSIRELTDRLPRIDAANAGLAEALRQAISYPGEETVYVVGGQPVIAFWGHRPVAAPEPESPPPTPEPASPPMMPPATSGGGMPRWLWAALALALLTLIGFGIIRGCDLPWPPWGPDYVKLLATAKNEEDGLTNRLAGLEAQLSDRLAGCAAGRGLAAAGEEEARLAALLADLETRLRQELALCPLKQEVAAAIAAGGELERRTDSLMADLQRALEACRRKQEEAKKREEEARKKAEQEQKKAEAARRKAEDQARKAEEAKRRAEEVARRQPPSPPAASPPAAVPPAAPPAAAPGEKPATEPTPPPKKEDSALPPCPGERTPEQAPDVAIVLDASGSMALPASASASEIQKHLRSVGGAIGGPLGGVIGLGAALLGGGSGPSRLDEAKKGVTNVVRSLPGDVDVGLVTLQRCPQATNHGFFGGGARASLYSKVAGLRPMQGTPLAQGLSEAAAMIDGVRAPAVMVVISDGEDSCGGDPCATARRLKAAKPELKINVVDITGDGAANCLAQVTGGRVLKPEDGLAFEKTIKQATEEALKPPHCP